MPTKIAGLHHVTAIAKDPQRNLDFYTQVLGMRLIKVTINYDDPGTYHFYFGDYEGKPGTLLTFFPYVDAYEGQLGPGQTGSTAFVVPEGAIDFWVNRLAQLGVEFEAPATRFGEAHVTLLDPDGMRIDLVGVQDAPGDGWAYQGVPAEHSIRGFHSVTLLESNPKATEQLLLEMGYVRGAIEADRVRYEAAGDAELGRYVDVVEAQGPRGRVAAGSVHHIAFRVPDAATQEEWREALLAMGANVSPVMDRDYFKSIYFREPGGVLFEFATDPPGMTIDEPLEELGSELRLPKWLEARRAEAEMRLPPLRYPA